MEKSACLFRCQLQCCARVRVCSGHHESRSSVEGDDKKVVYFSIILL